MPFPCEKSEGTALQADTQTEACAATLYLPTFHTAAQRRLPHAFDLKDGSDGPGGKLSTVTGCLQRHRKWPGFTAAAGVIDASEVTEASRAPEASGSTETSDWRSRV
eukprot:366486-Chlamydomonas_euryale.AAC.10